MIPISISTKLPSGKTPLLLPLFHEEIKKSMRKPLQGLTSLQKRSVRKAFQNGRLLKKGLVPIYSSDEVVFLYFLGEKKKFQTRESREAGEQVFSQMSTFEVESLSVLPGMLREKLWIPFLEGVSLGTYEFTEWKGKKEDKKEKEKKLKKLHFYGKNSEKLMRRFQSNFDGIKWTKDLINTPPMVSTPSYLEKCAKEIAKKYSAVTISVLGEKELKKLHCGGILGVGQGSEEESRLIILTYNGGKKEKPIALIGKGVTFDTGGLNIKTGGYMRTMKQDLGGAATVLGAFFTIVQSGIKKNVLCVIPTVENLVSKEAYKPDDVLTLFNGKTVEVTNTDAEGRLILADALAYTESKLKPRVMIDVATLTGACAYAIGDDYTALLGTDSKVIQALKKSSLSTDEPVWELPLHDRYKKCIESKIADIMNASRKLKAGTIEGGLFLQHFVTENMPWCHLDIASVTFDENTEMATGRNVRLLADFVEHY